MELDQVNPENTVVGNPNAFNEVQESEITPTEIHGPHTVRKKYEVDSYRDVDKGSPTKVCNVYAFVALALLVALLFLGVIAFSVAFAVEVPGLKTETNTLPDQQSRINALSSSAAEQLLSVSALVNRLDNLNSSMERLSQQLFHVMNSQARETNSLMQRVNSLELLSRELRENISGIEYKTQEINSSLEIFSQQIFQEISVVDNRIQQVYSSQQILSQQLQQNISALESTSQEINSSLSRQLFQDVSAVGNRIDQVNSTQQTLSQQIQQDISSLESRSQEINSSLSQQLLQDISTVGDKIEQLNSSQLMLSQQLEQDISALESTSQEINSSLSQHLLQDVPAIDSRIEQVNSSQQILSQQLQMDISALESRSQEINSSLFQQLLQDISAVGNKIELVNSSQQTFSQQLQQDISALDSRTQEINSSLSQQLLQDISELQQDISSVGSMAQEINSSLSQHLLQDVPAIDSRIEQINSSQQILSQQLQQDISAIDIRIEQVNTSLLQEVDEVRIQSQETLNTVGILHFGEAFFPASSCADILSHSNSSGNGIPPSGFYYLKNINGSAVRVYCDMDLSCGGVSGWMRVVDVDYNENSNASCPSGLGEDIDPDTSVRTCVNNGSAGCNLIEFYSTSDIPYSSVCGKMIVYQFGTPEAFSRSIVISSLTADSQYLDGISLTHGNPRTHVWSFAVGVTEGRTDRFGCPCNVGSTVSASAFVGSNYFCDSAASGLFSGMRYPNNPLFDGVGCAATNGCCDFNNPPWFYRQLSNSTSDPLEMRVCRDESFGTENTFIQSIELYVN